jgi:hypothetical protein
MAYTHGMSLVPQVIVETTAYIARSEAIFSAVEREEVLLAVASQPEAGVVIQGTGGIRKRRFGVAGRGKSGGVRVIYYFHSDRMPIYLLTLFAKNERSDLTDRERQQLARLVDLLIAKHGVKP